MSEDIIPESLPAGIPPEGGEATASAESKPLHETLSELLGKEFPTDESAKKAVKDTFNYVGGVGQYKETMSKLKQTLGLTDEQAILKRMEEIVQQPQGDTVSREVQELKARLDETEFYSENPDFKPYSSLLNELRGSTGKPLKEVAESEAFKSVAEKAKAFDETEKQKSVLGSSPRLAKVQDNFKTAREQLDAGDDAGARKSAVSAVLQSLE